MKISQREARRLRKHNVELEKVLADQRNRWCSEWPSFTCIAKLRVDDVTAGKINTARLLEHAVVVTMSGNDMSLFASRLRRPHED